MNNFLLKFFENIGRKKPACFFIIFVLSFLFFFFVIQPFNTFPDPDSFYHAKMGVLTADGFVKDFPWLQFTGLKDYFTDHHLAYHILLVPFIFFFGPLLGTKIASVFFASLLISVLYLFLKEFKIRGALFYILILLISYPFIFRINLAKSGVLAITILILVLYALFRNKPVLLFILSFLYVWTHGSWPVALGLTFFYVIISSLVNKKLSDIKLFISCFFGLVAGLVINPYFPQNIIFYWIQTIQIGFLNYQSEIGVGAEWYGSKFEEFFTGSSLVFILFFISFIAFIFSAIESKKQIVEKKEIIRIFTLLIISGVFFILTIKSVRNVEYFIPLTVLTSAFILNLVISRDKLFLTRVKDFFMKRKRNIFILVYFLVAFSYISFLGIKTARGFFEDGFSWNYFEKSSKIIEEKSQPRDIIFHSSWDNFPALFYHNIKNYYIVGLDPTFFYLHNKELYEKWEDIRQGEEKDNLSETIKNDFNSSWIFIEKRYDKFRENIESDNKIEKIYEDEEASVYKIK